MLCRLKHVLADLDAKTASALLWASEMLDLPHRPTTKEEARQMVDALGAQLRRAREAGTIPRPAFVTVACSSDDGFVPRSHVSFLVDCVKDMLLRVYRGGSLRVYIEEDARCLFG